MYILSIAAPINKDVPLKNLALQPGTDTLPITITKAVIRFTNPDSNLNNTVRVESEVASIKLTRDAIAPLGKSIVPQVYRWNSAANGNGWVLMEHMSGIPLQVAVFQKLDDDAKKKILSQIGQILKLIQEYKLPPSVVGYGGLSFAEDGNVVVGPTPIHGATKRCETYHELYTEYVVRLPSLIWLLYLLQ